MTTNYSNLIANIFTAVNVLPQCNRPGTEDVEFWAQMTAISLNPNGCAPVDVFIAIAETLGYDWDFDSVELAMNKADAWGGTGDDFGRLEVFTIDRPNGIFGLHGKVYVEIYYDDPECDMPERYADEVDDWAEFVHEAYLQDEQTAREAEAQASASASFDAPQLFKIVMVSAGGVKHDWMCCLTQDEADRVLEDNLWQYCDENGFVWNLEVEEDTDAMLEAEGFTVEDVDDVDPLDDLFEDYMLNEGGDHWRDDLWEHCGHNPELCKQWIVNARESFIEDYFNDPEELPF